MPWTQVVRSYVLPDVLQEWERKEPKHPLVAVFKPLLAESDEALQRQAGGYFRSITQSSLSSACKRTLEEVFVSWLVQRFKDKTRKQIETMLLGELPELDETVAGKELIRIGEKRGEKRALEEAILAFLATRHGRVPAAVTGRRVFHPFFPAARPRPRGCLRQTAAPPPPLYIEHRGY